MSLTNLIDNWTHHIAAASGTVFCLIFGSMLQSIGVGVAIWVVTTALRLAWRRTMKTELP